MDTPQSPPLGRGVLATRKTNWLICPLRFEGFCLPESGTRGILTVTVLASSSVK